MGAFIISPLPSDSTQFIPGGRVSLLRRHYSASSLILIPPPPARRRPISRLSRLYGLPSFRRFRGGARRVSPVARHVLMTMLSLPPRRCDSSRQSDFDESCCLHPHGCGLGPRIHSLSRPHTRSLTLRPGHSQPPFRWCRR